MFIEVIELPDQNGREHEGDAHERRLAG